jgi:NitT/TauT family transport system substrate-binding protein
MISAFPAASGSALLRVAIATALTLLMHGACAQDRPAETKVRLVVGGKSAIFYLPLSVTERLGYFKELGIDAEIADVQSGARALQSLIGGSADLGVGTFDHTIQMQAKGQPVVAVLQYGLYPGFVLGTLASKAIAYAGPQSLKGLKIGVTSPGSSRISWRRTCSCAAVSKRMTHPSSASVSLRPQWPRRGAERSTRW